MWLVNIMIEQGWIVEKGHILLTDALGKMLPVTPGKYHAGFGDLGKIDFEIKWCSEYGEKVEESWRSQLMTIQLTMLLTIIASMIPETKTQV